MSPGRLLSLVLHASFACALVGATGTASAQNIEEARGRWFDADFEASRDEFRSVLASPALTPAHAVDAHRYLAAIHLALGESEAARAHAEAAVALDPSAEPPEGAPRGAEDLFRMARRRLGDRRAELTVEPRGAVARGVAVTVVTHLDPAPPALEARLVVRCGTAEATGEPPAVEVVVVPESDVVCVAEARTPAGAVLLSVTRELHLPVRTSEAGALGDGEVRRKRWPWIVGSVALAAVAGVVTGVVVHNHNQPASFGGTTVVGW